MIFRLKTTNLKTLMTLTSHIKNKFKSHTIFLKQIFFAFSILFFFTKNIQSQDIPERPKPQRLVNDYTGILKPTETQQLEDKLALFNDSTSTQITIVIVNDLKGYAPAEFATEIGNKWGVGQKGFDNGAVVLIKPKTKDSKGQAYIAIGYGLEGAIPDATAKRIVENAMIPNFKDNNYYKGIDEAVNTMISIAKGEFTAKEYMNKGNNKMTLSFIFIILAIIFFVFIKFARVRSYSATNNIPFWTAFWLLGSSSHHSSGSFGNFSGGSGGFGGFGGGSFGGGGAGGSW